jgi:hydrogenase-4 component F
MIWALLLIPAAAGILAFVIRPNGPRRVLMFLAAAAHTALVATAWHRLPEPVLRGWLAIDAVALLFLSITSVLFLMATIYAIGYLDHEARGPSQAADDLPFVNFSEATFAGCLMLFLATMTLAAVSRHFGLMWVAVEATTLASAPLVYFHRSRRSLEATWKYLVICSVGIALALLGSFFLAVAAHGSGGVHLTIDELVAHAAGLRPLWLKAAMLFFLVGYGTKMGLAPLHTWLPDAHSEAPSVVSALLSGALLNCAFLAILRGHSVLAAAGMGDFSRDLLVLLGLLSMALAALFIIGQADFKRMLAYSSVEHMGILALGIGIGGIATVGSLLHTVNHSLAKAMLFLVAGNTLAFYHTKSTVHARGVLKVLPVTGVLWVAGFLAIAGSPPFGLFLSELTILKGILDAGRPLVAVVYLATLAVVFVGLASIVLNMVYGPRPGQPLRGDAGPAAQSVKPRREPLWSIVPPIALGAGVLLLGVYVPQDLMDLIQRAARCVGGN